MSLIGNHNDVISIAVRLLGVNVLVELVYQAEDVAMIFLERDWNGNDTSIALRECSVHGSFYRTQTALRLVCGNRYEDALGRSLGAISVHAPRDKIAFKGPIKDLLHIPWLEKELVAVLEAPLRAHLTSTAWRDLAEGR